ncbi:Ku protein [Streptomyces sp. NPDC059740]|uniref:non-homologous end joining protein Ku n=1 Tax=Streptomyces sp. NPDC059740 TaxID=3346926 RepID=UPI0036697D93
MPRAIWSGVLTFGLVTVPVQLFTATSGHTVHFHQLQRGTGDRVRNQRVNERTGEEVPYDDIVKGYDLGGEEFVVVEPGELDEVAPGRSKAIEISGFVDAGELAPVYFDRAYYLSPKGDQYGKVYALLRAALERTGKVGVATFVMRAKEYLVALRAQEEVLVLHTLHWADEVRDPREELPQLPGRADLSDSELRTAEQLVEALGMEWRPEDFHDTYVERVQELVAAKAEGREVTAAQAPPEATEVVDLMDALRRSVDARGTQRGGQRKGARQERASSSKKRGSGSGRSGGTGGRRGASSRAGSSGKGSGSGKGGGRAGGDTGLAKLTKGELYERAAREDMPGRSSMTRQELLDALSGSRPKAAS